jgi:hypothetical protein
VGFIFDPSTFQTMSPGQAEAFQRKFLAEQPIICTTFARRMAAQGISADYSTVTGASVLEWFSAHVQLVQPVPAVGGGEYEPDSVRTVIAAGYYLGEALRRAFPVQLGWTLGDPETADANQPVVRGFRNGIDLQPVRALEVFFRRILNHSIDRSVLGDRLAYWLDQADPHGSTVEADLVHERLRRRHQE